MLEMGQYLQFIYFCAIEGMFVYFPEAIVIQIPLKVKHYQRNIIREYTFYITCTTNVTNNIYSRVTYQNTNALEGFNNLGINKQLKTDPVRTWII